MQKKTFTFSIDSIEELEFSYTEFPSVSNESNKNDLSANIKAFFIYKPEQDLLGLILNISTVLQKDKNEEQVLMNYKNIVWYRIEGLNSFFDTNKKIESQIPEEALHAMSGTSYSTTRGIIFVKTANTPYNKLILPMITTDKLLSLISK